jgi:hypothetical protein
MASPASREPGPLVTFARNRTVAKVDSIDGIRGLEVDPVLGPEAEAGERGAPYLVTLSTRPLGRVVRL